MLVTFPEMTAGVVPPMKFIETEEAPGVRYFTVWADPTWNPVQEKEAWAVDWLIRSLFVP